MQFVKGMIVRSKAGHDKGRFYVVYQTTDRTVFLTDADRTSSKKKNPLHLAPTKTVLSEEQLSSDNEIQKILAVFDSRVRHS